MNVIETENLQANALTVGDFLLEKCTNLMNDFEMVGDVRGWGLFVGLEIVKSKECRTPATYEAEWIVDRMKSKHRVLISSDGPDENVLKLKPPMVFNLDNAKEFLVAVTECLATLRDTLASNNSDSIQVGVPKIGNKDILIKAMWARGPMLHARNVQFRFRVDADGVLFCVFVFVKCELLNYCYYWRRKLDAVTHTLSQLQLRHSWLFHPKITVKFDDSREQIELGIKYQIVCCCSE